MIEVVPRQEAKYTAVEVTLDFVRSDEGFDWIHNWLKHVTMHDIRVGDIGGVDINDRYTEVFLGDWIILRHFDGKTEIVDVASLLSFQQRWRKVPVYQKSTTKVTTCYCGECSGSKCLNIPC